MTQEVQPLTWSKRTNIEEHQQFFSKINEIIGNLAPTVDEAEQAIAQATAAIASANDAVATANAASAAASAAASQAQTAASTVAGYDGRLTAAEGDISALGTRMSAAESKNSQQDTAIAALQSADTQNVKINDINQYAVGLTGNQNIAGNKIWLNDMLIRKTNPGYITVDEREFSGITDSQTTGNRVVSILDNGAPKNLMMDQIRVNGFGVSGGVERLMWTYCKIGDTWKSVILRIQMNPTTRKAQLRFGNTVIAEADI